MTYNFLRMKWKTILPYLRNLIINVAQQQRDEFVEIGVSVPHV